MKKKRRRLKKKPIIILGGVILIFILFISLISSCSKEEQIEEKRKISFITNFTNSSAVAIDDSIEKTITDFMDLYYLSMKELTEYNMMHLFSSDAMKQAYLTQTAMNYLVNYRLAQRNNLRLDDCSYELKVTKVKKNEDKLVVTVLENSSVKFSFMDITSDSYNIENTFTFKNEKDNYELVEFNKNADFYNVFTLSYKIDSAKSDNDIKNDLIVLNNEAIDLVKASVENEKSYYEAYLNNQSNKTKKCDHTYNRELAYSYAMLWVNTRNSEYSAFDSYGGNCQNYASQVMSSGGIPMDLTGNYKWKWYGSTVDETANEKGRTPSWTGVGQFYNYAKNNSGAGLCASVNVNYFYAEKGDVMQVGAKGEYVHSIVVSGLVTKDGKVLDVLTTSNTTDRKNYPLSAYNYSNKRLIKIHGWNENSN